MSERGLRRFYLGETFFSGEGTRLRLSSRETYHLHQVLRFKKGEVCQVFNRKGQTAEAVIQLIEPEGAWIELTRIFPPTESNLLLKVGQALPQKRKMDHLVATAEQLEVRELWVLETRRNIVRMKAEAMKRTQARWERIVVEAAKQSGNPALMQIGGPVSFENVIKENLESKEQAFIFHPDSRGIRFSEMIEKIKSRASRSLFLFLGPEGGFTEEEVRLAESRGVQKVFLGDSILRLETAFASTIGAIRLLLG